MLTTPFVRLLLLGLAGYLLWLMSLVIRAVLDIKHMKLEEASAIANKRNILWSSVVALLIVDIGYITWCNLSSRLQWSVLAKVSGLFFGNFFFLFFIICRVYGVFLAKKRGKELAHERKS